MIDNFAGKTAVLTGAGSGFGLECARIGARLGMNLVLVDVQQDALDAAAAEMRAAGAQVLAQRVDVSNAAQMEALAAAVLAALWRTPPGVQQRRCGRGRPGVGKLGERLGMGAGREPHGRGARRARVHPHDAGRRQGRPRLARPHRQHRQHGGLAGSAQHGHLQREQACGGVSLSETLYQDLSLVTDQISASVLCPFFVPTGISQSHRNRPGDLPADKPTKSQLIGQAMSDKAVGSGKVTAAEVAQKVFDAAAARPVLHLQPPQGHGLGADAHGRHHAGPQPHRPVCGQARAGYCSARFCWTALAASSRAHCWWSTILATAIAWRFRSKVIRACCSPWQGFANHTVLTQTPGQTWCRVWHGFFWLRGLCRALNPRKICRCDPETASKPV
jgi:NAD(P)-dependent dehydrogenase (short-subunit alcohol dehydrogenase family)